MKRLYRTFIVEDNAETLISLKRELEPHGDIILIDAVATNYNEALSIILKSKFDLSILDKLLDEGYTCFNLIENSNYSHFGVIALNSVEPSIPLEDLRLLKEKPLYIGKPYTQETIRQFILQLNELENKSEDKIIILDAGNEGKVKIKEKSILYIEAERGYIIYHLSEPAASKSKWTIDSTLSEALEDLDRELFLQVHKSYIVNTKKIERLGKGDTRTSGKLILAGGDTVDYSKEREREILDAMKKQ